MIFLKAVTGELAGSDQLLMIRGWLSVFVAIPVLRW